MNDEYRAEPLTISEVMRMTKRSRRTIDRWIKDGHLHAVDLGGFDGLVLDRGEVARYEKQMRDNLHESQTTASDPSQDPAT